MPNLVLASTSPHRAKLLARLGLPFQQVAPAFTERLHGAEPKSLVRENTLGKARAVASARPGATVIASDQLAWFEGGAVGKPGSIQRAMEQLNRFSGHAVDFYTGVACISDGQELYACVPTRVHFRPLEEHEIQHYVERERPLDCAGSFKSEGLGIALLARIDSEDPTALIGLPLITLAGWLRPLSDACFH
ncbi:MAG: septum formation protein Maf [Zetaproteobacteria bacterium]|nr:MAG: septum formation protein Maf [Zetaproteobacteria bacterium]